MRGVWNDVFFLIHKKPVESSRISSPTWKKLNRSFIGRAGLFSEFEALMREIYIIFIFVSNALISALHRAVENIEKPFFEERITKIVRSTGRGQSAFFWGRRALGFGRKFRPAAIALSFNQACLFVKLIKRAVICSRAAGGGVGLAAW